MRDLDVRPAIHLSYRPPEAARDEQAVLPVALVHVNLAERLHVRSKDPADQSTYPRKASKFLVEGLRLLVDAS